MSQKLHDKRQNKCLCVHETKRHCLLDIFVCHMSNIWNFVWPPGFSPDSNNMWHLTICMCKIKNANGITIFVIVIYHWTTPAFLSLFSESFMRFKQHACRFCICCESVPDASLELQPFSFKLKILVHIFTSLLSLLIPFVVDKELIITHNVKLRLRYLSNFPEGLLARCWSIRSVSSQCQLQINLWRKTVDVWYGGYWQTMQTTKRLGSHKEVRYLEILSVAPRK